MTHRNRKPCDYDTVVVGSKTYDQLWAETAAKFPKPKPDGEGWKCAEEIAKLVGRDPASARKYCEREVRRGRFERFVGCNEDNKKKLYYRPLLKP